MVERIVTWRTRTAAVLLWLAVAGWLWQSTRETSLGRMALWLVAAFVVFLAGLGTWRGYPALLRAVRRSTATILVMFGILLALPAGPSDEPIPLAQRLRFFGPMLLWAAAVTGLLWTAVPATTVAPAGEPVAKAPPGASKRKRRRRRSK